MRRVERADLGEDFVQNVAMLRQMQVPGHAGQKRRRRLTPRRDDRRHVPVHLLPTEALPVVVVVSEDVRHEIRPAGLRVETLVDLLARQPLVLVHGAHRRFDLRAQAPREGGGEGREAQQDAAEDDGLDAGEEHLHPEMVAFVLQAVEGFAE